MSEYEDVILAIDEGTSGTRAAVVAQNSQVHCLEYQPLQVSSLRHGVVEQDADEVLQATIEVCRKAIANAQCNKMRIVALAIATQRSTAVLWDAQTGKALTPAMVWQDARFTDELAQLAPEWDAKLLPRIGRPVGIRSPYLWASRHLANTPAVAKAYQAGTLVFGTVDSWLLWHLAQEKKVSPHRQMPPPLARIASKSITIICHGYRLWASRRHCCLNYMMMPMTSAPLMKIFWG